MILILTKTILFFFFYIVLGRTLFQESCCSDKIVYVIHCRFYLHHKNAWYMMCLVVSRETNHFKIWKLILIKWSHSEKGIKWLYSVPGVGGDAHTPVFVPNTSW